MLKHAVPSAPTPVYRHLLILLVIVAVGVFFRTYHFHDWLQFSPDEARDATYIGDALTGKAPLPMLGPQAGNTQFYLGPLYYQAEYLSARLFGNAPDKMAYFDLLFSILAIPMLFLFLKRYFSEHLALSLTAVMSVSYFAVKISRFASNPNTIPFFTLLFLYGLLWLMDRERKRKYIPAAFVGIGMGVGIQLHTLLFPILPAVAVGMCAYLIARKNLSRRDFAIALSFFLLMNYGQIAYDIRYDGANIRQLFKGAGSESGIGAEALLRNVSLIASCQAQANVNVVFSAIDVQSCGGIYNIAKAFRADKYVPGNAAVNGVVFIVEAIMTLFFSIGGYALAIRSLRKEQDENRRNFLSLFLFYNAVSFVVLVPVASQIEVRYFSILLFVPFILLGLWLSAFLENGKKTVFGGFVGIVAVLVVANILTLASLAQPFLDKSASDVDNSILGEAESMTAYLVSHTDTPGTVRLDGQPLYLKRFLKPFDYLARKEGMSVTRPASKQSFDPGTRFFFIDGTKSKPYTVGDDIGGGTILGYEQFGRIMIYSMTKRP